MKIFFGGKIYELWTFEEVLGREITFFVGIRKYICERFFKLALKVFKLPKNYTNLYNLRFNCKFMETPRKPLFKWENAFRNARGTENLELSLILGMSEFAELGEMCGTDGRLLNECLQNLNILLAVLRPFCAFSAHKKLFTEKVKIYLGWCVYGLFFAGDLM